MRGWQEDKNKHIEEAYKQKKLVRVQTGYHHKTTIGWLLITHLTKKSIDEMTPLDYGLEGCKGMTKKDFHCKYFVEPAKKQKVTPLGTHDKVSVVVFRLHALPTP